MLTHETLLSAACGIPADARFSVQLPLPPGREDAAEPLRQTLQAIAPFVAAGSRAQQDQVFRNMYWSGTQPDAPVPVNVQHFKTFTGIQSYGVKGDAIYAVAVRPGDATAAVPEQQTLARLRCRHVARVGGSRTRQSVADREDLA